MSLLALGPERKLALVVLLTALGVALSPLFIPIPPTKAYPAQHMINVIAGASLGPLYAVVIATLIGIIRISLGLGTIYAIPGGLPGAFMVGAAALILLRRGSRVEYSALAEPLGTAVIGFLLAYIIFAPLVGDAERWAKALSIIWLGWLASSLSGTIIGFAVLRILRRAGII